MLSIILKQLLKYKYPIIGFIILWIVSGIWIYNQRFQLLAFLYKISSNVPETGSENPLKAYKDYFLPAYELLIENQIDLKKMEDICPTSIKSYILLDSEYQWDFLRKYNYFSYDQEYIFKKSYSYWLEKKPIVEKALLLLKESTRYAFEIPADYTIEKKNILLPLFIQQCFNAICFPTEGKKFWRDYIIYLEHRFYKEKKIHEELPYPMDLDLDLLFHLQNEYKYQFAIYQYIEKQIPFELIENCNSQNLACLNPTEVNYYYNKLLFISPKDQWGKLFLNQARLYQILGKDNEKFFKLALDRYRGAMDFTDTKIDAYLEIINLFLKWNKPENALKIIQEFKTIKPKSFFREELYYTLIYKTLSLLKHYKEADCFRSKYIDTTFCKKVREDF